MRTSRIPASVAFATGVATPVPADDDGGNCGNAPRARRATEVCYEVRGANVGLQDDPVTGTVAKTGGAAR
jgi:hypothetical protein